MRSEKDDEHEKPDGHEVKIVESVEASIEASEKPEELKISHSGNNLPSSNEVKVNEEYEHIKDDSASVEVKEESKSVLVKTFAKDFINAKVVKDKEEEPSGNQQPIVVIEEKEKEIEKEKEVEKPQEVPEKKPNKVKEYTDKAKEFVKENANSKSILSGIAIAGTLAFAALFALRKKRT